MPPSPTSPSLNSAPPRACANTENKRPGNRRMRLLKNLNNYFREMCAEVTLRACMARAWRVHGHKLRKMLLDTHARTRTNERTNKRRNKGTNVRTNERTNDLTAVSPLSTTYYHSPISFAHYHSPISFAHSHSPILIRPLIRPFSFAHPIAHSHSPIFLIRPFSFAHYFSFAHSHRLCAPVQYSNSMFKRSAEPIAITPDMVDSLLP